MIGKNEDQDQDDADNGRPMIQDKNTPELPGHISTRTSGTSSAFSLGFLGRWGAWIVLVTLLLTTFTTWYIARGEMTKRAQARFDFRVKTIESEIHERLKAYEYLLRGCSGLFAASDKVTRREWQTYVTSLDINQHYQGLQGIGFSKRILPSEKETHIRQIRAEGFPQYDIKPGGERPEFTSIIFLEPFDWRNQRAFGYDMFSEPVRKEAMTRARDTGLAAMSGKVTLLQEASTDVQAGFLMYLPVYRKGEQPKILEKRREELAGYVYSPFRVNNFMQGILAEKQGYAELQIFDGDKPLKETLLYISGKAERALDHSGHHHFATYQSILEYAGHRWLLVFVSSKYFEENIETGLTNFILLLGITVSLLLFGIVLSLTRSRGQAIAMANITLDLEKANIGLRKEITNRKQAEENIKQMVYHDSLTGLPNRKLFSDRLGIALAQAQRNKKEIGIAMLDLDHFKGVNDTLGHNVGDLLLKATAERLSAALRKGDTVARFAGDEFLLILPDLKFIEDAIQVAQKIVDRFSKPFLVGTHQVLVTTSIGIAVYPNDGIDEGILLKNADIAMYQAKQAGGARYQLCKKA